jgi:hypothetical protein
MIEILKQRYKPITAITKHSTLVELSSSSEVFRFISQISFDQTMMIHFSLAADTVEATATET